MRLPALLCLLPLVPLGGCCSFARLFCGPDRSPWVAIDYSTPEKAVRTFLEALRRDEPMIVYEAMSHAYRQRLELDRPTVLIAWPKVKQENPYLHVAGYAEVPPAERRGDVAAVELVIEGRHLAVELVRQRRFELRYPLANGERGEPGTTVTTFTEHVALTEQDGDFGKKVDVRLTPPTLRTASDAIPVEEIQFCGFVAEWKVNRVTARGDG